MKKGVFGVGPKEIAYGCYDGDTVEVCMHLLEGIISYVPTRV